MLEQKLKLLIPQEINEFPKIERIGDPYHFENWELDKKSNGLIMRYWFWNKDKSDTNKKRVFINEFESLLRFSFTDGGFKKTDFIRLCPKTNSDGGCGFTVMVGILEHQRIIEKAGHGSYELINSEKIKKWLT